MTGEKVICTDHRPCFARTSGMCQILTRGYYGNVKCPFCKPEKEVTKGKRYPWDRAYGKSY